MTSIPSNLPPTSSGARPSPRKMPARSTCCRARWKLWALPARACPLKKTAQRQSTIFMRGWATLHRISVLPAIQMLCPLERKATGRSTPLPARKKTGFYGARCGRHERCNAAFVSAVSAHLEDGRNINGSISLLITGDEEGPSINGTRKMLDWLKSHGEVIDDCVVGEPTNPDQLGDMIKIGRRGSVNGVITVNGAQGHVAYPHLAANPVPQLAAMVNHLSTSSLDAGTEHFQPSNLEITSFDVGNATTNVIPAQATARFNIRYNDSWQADTISDWIRARLDESAGDSGYELALDHTGDCFLTAPNSFVESLSTAVQAVTGKQPELSTSGGTSDARFIMDAARVVEFGLVGKTMHKVDERVRIDDIRQLAEIYTRLLNAYFS